MNCSTPMQRTIWIIASLVCALAALHVGFLGFGINVLHGPFITMRMHTLIRPIDWLVGICGIYLFVTTLMYAFGKISK